LPQPIFYLILDATVLDSVAGIEKLSFSENSLAFQLQQLRIARRVSAWLSQAATGQ